MLRNPYLYLTLFVLLVVVAAFSITIGLLPSWYGAPKSAGEFGDMFGSVNALFSGLALLGVVVAILMQRSELRLQREELEQTRMELRGQKEQLVRQNSTMEKQAFNNTFFHIISLHNDIVRAIDLSHGGNYRGENVKISSGQDAFEAMLTRQFGGGYAGEYDQNKRPLKGMTDGYSEIYSEHTNDLGHYFRNLFHAVEFVHTSEVDDKRFFTNIIRAQLSSSEIVMLFLNGITEIGREKFKSLIEHYGLLKNIPNSEYFISMDAYEPAAFQGQDDG